MKEILLNLIVLILLCILFALYLLLWYNEPWLVLGVHAIVITIAQLLIRFWKYFDPFKDLL
jgi:hypothetical protein